MGFFRLCFALLIFIGFTPPTMYAVDEPLVRVQSDMEAVWVGQKASFIVELLSPTFFSGSPHFDLPDVPGALLMKIPGRPLVTSENIDGHTYSIQVHEFVLFPRRPGSVTIPSFPVRFGVAGAGGSEPAEHTIRTRDIHVEAETPPGAEKHPPMVSTRQLTVKELWSPEPVDAAVGDAFTRTITFTASDIPGMAFPPIPESEIPGIGVYGKEPMIRDKTERGEFTGERIETVTYVCERKGAVILPAVVFHWWDIETEEVKTVELPEVKLDVAPAPGMDDPVAEKQGGAQLSPIELTGIILLLFLSIVFLKFRLGLKQAWAAWRLKRAESEPAYFARLIRACRANDPIPAYNALMRWLDRITVEGQTPTIRGFIKQHPAPGLEKALSDLQQALLSAEPKWRGDSLAGSLKKYRNKSGHLKPRKDSTSLPVINPVY